MLFWHLLRHENAHIRFSMLRFSFGRSFKIAVVIRFFVFLGMLFWHLACRQNPHIRQVCCGFAAFDQLQPTLRSESRGQVYLHPAEPQGGNTTLEVG